MKPSYKANNAKYWKTYRNKNIGKIRKRDKDRKQFTRKYLKYCDAENMKSRTEKIGKEKDWQKKGGKKRQLQQH